MSTFDGVFLLAFCTWQVPHAVPTGKDRHTSPEAVRVLAPTALEHDVAAVIVAQTSAQLLIVHSRLPLALAPQPGHLGCNPEVRGARGWTLATLGGAGFNCGRGWVGTGSRTGLGSSPEWVGFAVPEELSHLFGVAQLELATVARPADAAAAVPVVEQLQEKLPQLNGTCEVERQMKARLLKPRTLGWTTLGVGEPSRRRLKGSRPKSLTPSLLGRL